MAPVSLRDKTETPQGGNRGKAGRFWFYALLVALAPVGFELGQVTLARWQAAVGRASHVETPILDYLSSSGEAFREQLGAMSTQSYGSLQWDPSSIVPLACCAAAACTMFLRRG